MRRQEMKEFFIENSIGLYLSCAVLYIVIMTDNSRKRNNAKMQYRSKEANK